MNLFDVRLLIMIYYLRYGICNLNVSNAYPLEPSKHSLLALLPVQAISEPEQSVQVTASDL